ncbi:MAG: hypothetical protein WB626_04045 [Bacteroidota bacterium]
MVGHPSPCQTLFSPRVAAVAAAGPLVRDVRGFDTNPAALAWTAQWDVCSSTWLSPRGGEGGFVFGGVSLGCPIPGGHGAGIQYTPGSAIGFVLPASITLPDSSPVAADWRVSYEEPFAAGYALRPAEDFAAGVGVRLRSVRTADTRYSLVEGESTRTITASMVEERFDRWLLDVGLQWKPTKSWVFSLVGRNLAGAGPRGPEGEQEAFILPEERHLEAGAAFTWGSSVTAAWEVSTGGTAAFGAEVSPGSVLRVRGGAYLDGASSPFLHALAVGAGVSLEFLDADISYLYFLDRRNRTGKAEPGAFDPARIAAVDLNGFTRDRLSLALRARISPGREGSVRIEGVRILREVYPSSSRILAWSPLGNVAIRNVAARPVLARVRFMADPFMDGPTETEAVSLQPGESREVAFTAVFNERLRELPRRTVGEGTVAVSSGPAGTEDDRATVALLLYGRNDWDGDAASLRHFVTTDDPAVLRTSRGVLGERRDSLEGVPSLLRAFRTAELLLDAFAGRLLYVADPARRADYVQYPSETLELGGGDCDDLTVCFSSLLASVGISTAFVDVVPPDRPQEAHLFLLFDTGVPAPAGPSVAANPKRYVVRPNPRGEETVWVPVETTVLGMGFQEAWSAGAQEYFDAVELGLGLVRGWVRILDVN